MLSVSDFTYILLFKNTVDSLGIITDTEPHFSKILSFLAEKHLTWSLLIFQMA